MSVNLCLDSFSKISEYFEPSDVVTIRKVSRWFRAVVTLVACETFFSRHKNVITRLGFTRLSENSYENFIALFHLLGALHEKKIFSHSILNRIWENTCKKSFRSKNDNQVFPEQALQSSWNVYQQRPIQNLQTFWGWNKNKSPLFEKINCKKKEFISIPPQIAQFSSLRKLKLTKCGLIHVPAFLEKLKHLRNLVLSDNKIQFVHCRFSNMPQLKYVDLGNNPLPNLPAQQLFHQSQVLCLDIDPDIVLQSSIIFSQYSSVFLYFPVRKPNDMSSKDYQMQLQRTVNHNASVFARATNREIVIEDDEIIDSEGINDLFAWLNPFYLSQFIDDEATLDRRMRVARNYLINIKK